MIRRRSALSLALALFAGVACDSTTAPDPISIAVGDATLESVGDVMQMTATVSGTDRLPEWESLHPQIATVTRAGMITAIAPGTATIRAEVGGKTAEAEVTVLPLVDVRLESVLRETDPSGAASLRMQIVNEGGRGSYRMQMWRARASAELSHEVVMSDFNDHPAPVGLDIGYRVEHPVTSSVDWIIVYSRVPGSNDYRMTSCVRLDGGTPCPMP